ncbi:MAG: alpha-L-fucosidase [Oceanipulchritudo sp.]
MKALHESGRESRLRNFESLAYGLFLHYGLYSLPGQGEWARRHHQFDPDAYSSLMDRFTAGNFDPPALVKFARSSGFRYICMTSRHHDGFSLYDTRGLNTYDAPHSAAGRDLVMEMAEACHEHHMGFFLYHTTLDWWEPRFQSDWKGYLQYLRDSVRLVCTHYGRLDGLWFDGNWSHPDRDWEEDALYDMIRELQPGAMIINNSSIGALGAEGHPALDAVTFEQGLPTGNTSRHVAREMCETLASHWGIGTDDFDHKSPPEIIRTLAGCRANGANLLLNAGPRADGSLTDIDRAVLARTGEWIERSGFGEILRNARPATGLRPRQDDCLLEMDGTLFYLASSLPIANYHSLHKGPDDWDRRSVTGDLPSVRNIHWMDNHEPLPFVQDKSNGLLAFRSSPSPYGSQWVVRIARINT